MNRTKRTMPPEWAEHQACWIAWPCRESIWSMGFDRAKQAYADVINNIAHFEPVNLLVHPDQIEEAKRFCSQHNIQLIDIAIDDSWTRDTLPFFVNETEKNHCNQIAVNWRFNAWGEKFLPFENDAALGEKIIKKFGLASDQIDMVLEGGSIHVDGNYTLMTTTECLLNPNRNPDYTQADIEVELSKYLGIDNFIWLPNGLFNDVDTDGHVDNIACFGNKETIVTMRCSDKDDPNYSIYQKNKIVLQDAKNSAGNSYHVVELEQPSAQFINNEPLVLSYINYYVANEAIIMPAFGDKHDDSAKEQIADIYRDREVIQIDALPILAGGGGIHCITMQQPKTGIQYNE